jgi:hypothetical protein
MRPVCPGFLGMLYPCLLGGRMSAGGRLARNGRIGLDQLSEPVPMRLRSAITAGTDAASRLSPVSCSRRRETRARPADSIRTLVARHHPGTVPAGRERARDEGRPPPGWPRGAPLRSTEGTPEVHLHFGCQYLTRGDGLRPQKAT